MKVNEVEESHKRVARLEMAIREAIGEIEESDADLTIDEAISAALIVAAGYNRLRLEGQWARRERQREGK